jgi:hypothetical protein
VLLACYANPRANRFDLGLGKVLAPVSHVGWANMKPNTGSKTLLYGLPYSPVGWTSREVVSESQGQTCYVDATSGRRTAFCWPSG